MGKFYAFLEIQTPLHANKTTEIEMNAKKTWGNRMEFYANKTKEIEQNARKRKY